MSGYSDYSTKWDPPGDNVFQFVTNNLIYHHIFYVLDDYG